MGPLAPPIPPGSQEDQVDAGAQGPQALSRRRPLDSACLHPLTSPVFLHSIGWLGESIGIGEEHEGRLFLLVRGYSGSGTRGESS